MSDAQSTLQESDGSTPIAAEQLRSFVDRIERLEADRAEIADDVKDLYSEAKSLGYDVKILRKVIARRRKGENAQREEDELLEVYEAAISGQGNLFQARAEAA